MAEKGWIVALPRSSQERIYRCYVRNNFSAAITELKKHYEQIAGNHKIDYERFVVAGSSMGVALAAQPYLDRQIPCRRFIPVGLYIKAPAELEEPVKEFALEGGKGCVLAGKQGFGMHRRGKEAGRVAECEWCGMQD